MSRIAAFLISTAFFSCSYGQNYDAIVQSNLPDSIKADSLDLLSKKYLLKLKYDSSKIILQKATAFALKSGNPTIIARCYVDFCSLLSMWAKYAEAEIYLNLAMPYIKLTDNYEIIIASMLQRANLFNVKDKKDSAIFWYRRAEEFNNSKNPYRNYVVYMSLGNLFSQMNDFKEADKNFDKAYNLTAKKEGRPDHGYLLMVYINYLLLEKRVDAAGKIIAEYSELMEERKRTNFSDPLQDVIKSVTNNKLENNVEFMKEVRDKSLENGEIFQAAISTNYITRYFERKKIMRKRLNTL